MLVLVMMMMMGSFSQSLSLSLSSYSACDNILSLADRVQMQIFQTRLSPSLKSWHHTKHIEQDSVLKTQQTELKF